MAEVISSQATQQPILGLARALLQANKLTLAQVDSVIKKSQQDRILFIDALIQLGMISPKELAVFCSETFGYPLMDIDAFSPESFPENVVDAKLMQTQHIFALAKRGNKISIAISDPTNFQALEQVKFQTELLVEPIIVQHNLLLLLLNKLAQNTEQNLNDLIGDDLEIDFGIAEETSSAPT